MLDERRLQAAGIAKPKITVDPGGQDAGEPAMIEGMRQKYRVDPEALAALETTTKAAVSPSSTRTTACSSIVRGCEELFEFAYVLEQFKPKPQRKYGYFAHPILMGDRFVGMLDAEVDKARDELRVTAVHEFLPFDRKSTTWSAPRSQTSAMAGRRPSSRRADRRLDTEPVTAG